MAAEQAPEREVVTFDRSWVRFAPLTGSGVVIGAAALGAGQPAAAGDRLLRSGSTRSRRRAPACLLVLVPLLVLGVLLVISLLSIAGYVVSNWGFRLTRTRGAATWH